MPACMARLGLTLVLVKGMAVDVQGSGRLSVAEKSRHGGYIRSACDQKAKNKVQDGMMFKMDDDPRIIGSEKKGKDGKPKGIGNFIRNTSLDEFPQFLNVLKGEMSLVGTRPPTLDEWAKYAPHHRARMAVRPGITGMWQISGRSEITDFEEVVMLDRKYLQNWSPMLDIEILFRIENLCVIFISGSSLCTTRQRREVLCGC